MFPKVPYNIHSRRIIVQCLLVITPMVASSMVVTYVVYANLVNQSCSSEELCPGSDILNATTKNHYYVDFPAARLALISSASSTVSFALIGILMAIYAYSNAASFLRTSERAGYEELPSPLQFSVILRILNSEWTIIWNVIWSKLWRVFWRKEKDVGTSTQSPNLVRNGVLVLLAGIVARWVRNSDRIEQCADRLQSFDPNCRHILPRSCAISRISSDP